MRCALIAVAAVTAMSTAACGSEASTPLAVEDSELSLGAEVYASSCASCHGADLRGTEKGPSHLSIVYEPSHHGDESFRLAIANGAPQHHWTFGNMPAVEGLSDSDVDAVIEFVREQQEQQGFER